MKQPRFDSMRSRYHRLGSGGFTIVELMIVATILGVLAAVAVPQFLQARAAARIGSNISEAIATARECQAFILSGIGATPAPRERNVSDGSVTIDNCDLNSGIRITASWPESDRAAEIRCLSSRSDINSGSAILQATPGGPLTCTFN